MLASHTWAAWTTCSQVIKLLSEHELMHALQSFDLGPIVFYVRHAKLIWNTISLFAPAEVKNYFHQYLLKHSTNEDNATRVGRGSFTAKTMALRTTTKLNTSETQQM